MIDSSDFRTNRLLLSRAAGRMPVLGFGTLIPDAAATVVATTAALEAGFRHFDCAERYGNEQEVGQALQAGLAARGISREDLFVTTKLWNTNHVPIALKAPSRQAWRGSGSTIWTYISATPHSHFNQATSTIRAIRTAISSTIEV